MILRRGVSWGDYEKQWALELTWHRMADCSKVGIRPPETHGRRQWTTSTTWFTELISCHGFYDCFSDLLRSPCFFVLVLFYYSFLFWCRVLDYISWFYLVCQPRSGLLSQVIGLSGRIPSSWLNMFHYTAHAVLTSLVAYWLAVIPQCVVSLPQHLCKSRTNGRNFSPLPNFLTISE